jgi:hypothetical protein
MASITIDPTDPCVQIVCGVGESVVSVTAAALYKAWKDWFVLSDNSKYLPAFDSAGGDPVGDTSLDNVYFIQTANGWKICPVTTELDVIIRINGNLFPDVAGAPLFGYDDVATGGQTHIETTVSTSARQIETGTSGLTETESSVFVAMAEKIALLQIVAGNVLADIRAVRGQAIDGTGTESDPWGPV